ncbi:hypothetical protein, partial [Escherichia coli]|uniref:hypothetical protein n=1 Tax=Escherichia coli TaxID=562 RepID=UPI001CCA268D
SNRKGMLFFAFFAPFILHFIYNGILGVSDLSLYLIIPFMFYLWWFGLTRVKRAHTFAMQQFRNKAQIEIK